MESADARHAPDDYAEMLRRIEAAHEQDVVDQALTAARERLCMDAAYITTIDPRQQTIDALRAASPGRWAGRWAGRWRRRGRGARRWVVVEAVLAMVVELDDEGLGAAGRHGGRRYSDCDGCHELTRAHRRTLRARSEVDGGPELLGLA